MLKRVVEISLEPNSDVLDTIEKEVRAINDTIGLWNHDVKVLVKGTQATDDGWHRITVLRLEVHEKPKPEKLKVKPDPMVRPRTAIDKIGDMVDAMEEPSHNYNDGGKIIELPDGRVSP